MHFVRYSSPSKINLHLCVGGPDASGFHALRSWFVTTDLADELHCTVALAPESEIRFSCVDASIPSDASNLVVRAARCYLDATQSERFVIDFELTKRIPVGAGLGGGSGNAATTLVLLDRLLGPLPASSLNAMAASLGSDVPFFLRTPSAIATGRGEQLSPAPPPRVEAALLCFPPFAIPTPAAYRTLDRVRPTPAADTLDAFDVDAWSRLGAAELMSCLRNDLEIAAFALQPSLDDLRIALERRLDRGVRMTGSGSTLFALYDDFDEANAAAARVADEVTGVRVRAVRIGRASVSPIEAAG